MPKKSPTLLNMDSKNQFSFKPILNSFKEQISLHHLNHLFPLSSRIYPIYLLTHEKIPSFFFNSILYNHLKAHKFLFSNSILLNKHILQGNPMSFIIAFTSTLKKIKKEIQGR